MHDYFPPLKELQQVKKYPDENLCLDIIFNHLYPSVNGHIYCPKSKCGKYSKANKITGRMSYSLRCGHQISPLSTTIFRRTYISLVVWFKAIDFISRSAEVITIRELQLQCGITSYSAWRIGHLIRGYLGLPQNYWRAKYGPLSYAELGVSTKAGRRKAIARNDESSQIHTYHRPTSVT